MRIPWHRAGVTVQSGTHSREKRYVVGGFGGVLRVFPVDVDAVKSEVGELWWGIVSTAKGGRERGKGKGDKLVGRLTRQILRDLELLMPGRGSCYYRSSRRWRAAP